MAGTNIASQPSPARSATTGQVTLPATGTYILEIASLEQYDGAMDQHTGDYEATVETP